MTRVIAGAARGRRLAVPPHGTRPTSDRVREAMFSALESQFAASGRSWSGVRVLDLFAGSGALGLEALSRGAATATLVERSRAAARVIAANVEVVGTDGANVLVRDVWRLAGQPVPAVPMDLCFADPPYDVAADRVGTLLAGLVGCGWLALGASVVVERPAADQASPLPESWTDVRRRAYGDTALWYGRIPAPDAGSTTAT